MHAQVRAGRARESVTARLLLGSRIGRARSTTSDQQQHGDDSCGTAAKHGKRS